MPLLRGSLERGSGSFPDPGSHVVGILLAAGRSTRFGADKLTQPLPDDGEWVAVRACRNLLQGVDRVVAVLRDGQEALRLEFDRVGADVVVCENAEQGMGTSLAVGIARNPEASGWLVALADMPWIAPETIGAVATAIRQGAGIAAPTFQGTRGHPVGFASAYRESLLSLSGDRGARSLLQGRAAEVCLVPCDDPGVLLDIDTPADLLARAPDAPLLPRGTC